jgi:hypothetical protein
MEIEAIRAAVPDLRPALATANASELADPFEAFDISVRYDNPNRRLELAATVSAPLAGNEKRPPNGRSRNSLIAGAGFEPATFGL